MKHDRRMGLEGRMEIKCTYNADSSPVQSSWDEYTPEKNDEMLEIAIDLGKSKEEHLVVHEGETARTIADNFAQKHLLTEDLKDQLFQKIHQAICEEQEKRIQIGNKRLEPACLLDEISENVSEDEEFKSFDHTVHEIPESISSLHNRFHQQYQKGKLIKIEPIQSNMSPNSNSWEKKVRQSLLQKMVASAHRDYSTQLPSPERNNSLEKYHRPESVLRMQKRKSTIYERGIAQQTARRRNNEEKKLLQEQKELEGFNFRPEINPHSKSRIRGKLEERLLEERARSKEKIDQYRGQCIINEKNALTFSPIINYNSVQLETKRKQSINDIHPELRQYRTRFEELYADSKRRSYTREKIKQLIPDSECTFKPILCKTRKTSNMQSQYNIRV